MKRTQQIYHKADKSVGLSVDSAYRENDLLADTLPPRLHKKDWFNEYLSVLEYLAARISPRSGRIMQLYFCQVRPGMIQSLC